MELKLLFLVPFILYNNGVYANEERWKCDDGSSILLEWKCDRSFDCEDRSDESIKNCPLRECRYDEFRCVSGACIPRVLVCNQEADCNTFGVEDFSDETQGCEDMEHPGCLFETEHKCTNGMCIPVSWVCDGTDDCGDNSDEEAFCDNDCYPGHVLCNSSHICIDERWICDGEEECEDGEDERNCQTTTVTISTLPSLCDVDEFECGGTCLPVTKACDGNLDCSSGVDEGDHCQFNDCKRRSDPLVWSSEGPLCDQLCRQTPQGPKCFCQPGYSLQQDGIRCRTTGYVLPKLFFSANREIRALLLHSSFPLERIEYTDYKNPNIEIISLEYEAVSRTLIWIEKNSNKVLTMDSSMHMNVLVQVTGLTGLSLDWMTRNLYISYKSINVGHLGVINLDKSKGLDELYILDLDLINPVSVVVHPKLGKIIVIDQGNNQTSSQLILADMDGKNADVLVTSRRRRMISVAVDYVTDIIYWSEVDPAEARVEMMKLDTYHHKTLISTYDHDLTFFNPSSLAAFEDRLYFSDNVTREIWDVDSVTGKPGHFVGSHPEPLIKAALVSRLLAIRVFHPIIQFRTEGSACATSSCSHLCVLRPGGSTCLCPAPMVLINENTCIDIITQKSTKSPPTEPVTLKILPTPFMSAKSSTVSEGALSTSRFTSASLPRSTATTVTTPTPVRSTANSRSTVVYSAKSITKPTFTLTTPPSTTKTPPSTTKTPPSTTTTPPSTTTTPPSTTTTPPSTTTTPPSTTTTPPSTTTTPPSTTFFSPTTEFPSKPTSLSPKYLAPKVSTTSTPLPTTERPTSTQLRTAGSTTTLSLFTSSTVAPLSSKGAATTKVTFSTSFRTSTTTNPPETITRRSYCFKPKSFDGGEYIGPLKPKYTLGSKVLYSCLARWHLPGPLNQKNSTITCSKLGEWKFKAPLCTQLSCSDLDCGKDGECISAEKKGAVCKCPDGNMTFTTCPSNLGRPQKTRMSYTGLIVGFILVAVLLLLIGTLVLRSYLRKPKSRYSLVENEQGSSLIDRKDYVDVDKLKNLKSGISNPNYSPTKAKFTLPLPDNLDMHADSSYSSPVSPGVYSYTFLKESDDTELSVDDEETLLNDDKPRGHDDNYNVQKLLDSRSAGVHKKLTSAFNLRKTESMENIMPRN